MNPYRAPMPDRETRERIRRAVDEHTRSSERLNETDTQGRNLGRAQLERRYTALDRRIEEAIAS